FSSRRRHTRFSRDWSSDVCSSDLRIIPLLSRYFDIVSAAIQQESGTIDKFIGDAVMAFWGAPAANPDHATDCCRAALACQRAVRSEERQVGKECGCRRASVGVQLS